MQTLNMQTPTPLSENIKKTLCYLPNHQRISEYYINKNIEAKVLVDHKSEIKNFNYSIENSLNILKISYPELYDNLSEKIIKKINGKKLADEEEEFVLDEVISATDTDTETESESENEFSDEFSQDDKYETESDFSD